MNMNYKICFCMHRQCLSVTIRRMCDEETLGRRRNEWHRSILTLVHWTVESILVMLPWWMWRSELGYDLSGTTTVMTREKLMAADAVIVFDERHRDAITRVLTIAIGTKSFCSTRWHLMKTAMWKTLITRLQLYIIVWLNTLKTVVNDW